MSGVLLERILDWKGECSMATEDRENCTDWVARDLQTQLSGVQLQL
jgi:hypothetical protein